MKILLTGGTGLLGQAFVRLLTERGMDFIAPSSQNLDLLDFQAVRGFITQEAPDLIIHCAAYTAVDQAETDHLACWELNVLALENLLSYQLPIVHFSTDYVFNAPPHSREGGDLTPFVIPPDYPRDPLNYYGESKAAAEVLLEVYQFDWWNIRTTWLYGEKGEGFPNKIKQRAESGEAIKVVNDQFGRKTLSPDLAQFVLDGLESGLETGHHHYQSPGPVHSWYEWACELVDTENVEPITTDSLNLPAVRPQNSVII